MADYWKSTGKWFCDICKCWTADNKASISFHENGKNHQQNKKNKITELKKNTIAKRKRDAKEERMFDKMEKNALAAVQKDIANSAAGVGRSDMKNIVAANSVEPSSERQDTYPWSAMLAPQGFTYYYNAQTGQSTWEMPEVFKKIEEKKRKQGNEVLVTSTKTSIKTSTKDLKQAETEEEEKVEERDVHPLLGGWSTVKSVEKNEDDETVEESKQNTEPVVVPIDDITLERESPRVSGKKFKEKVMTTNLGSSGEPSGEPVTFKKRKSAQKNVRKRNDDN